MSLGQFIDLANSRCSFLWIDFQLDELAQVSERDMINQLRLLPSGLKDTYIQYLQKINAQPLTSKVLAQRCFLWAFHTDYLLTSTHFVDAISFVNDHEKIDYKAHDLMAATKNLIRIFGGFFRVRPVHFSFKEFY